MNKGTCLFTHTKRNSIFQLGVTSFSLESWFYICALAVEVGKESCRHMIDTLLIALGAPLEIAEGFSEEVARLSYISRAASSLASI
jgi:hypothetical protein